MENNNDFIKIIKESKPHQGQFDPAWVCKEHPTIPYGECCGAAGIPRNSIND